MNIIILSGMPATGKSTLAAKLQQRFGYPILEKDYIKEGLFDTLGFSCYAEKKALDAAATDILLRMIGQLAKTGGSMIVDNNFNATDIQALNKILEEHDGKCVTVFLTGDPQVLYERYVERDSHFRRHIGHAMQTHYPLAAGEAPSFAMTRETYDQRFLHQSTVSDDLQGACIPVDTTDLKAVNMDAILDAVAAALN